MSVRWVYLSKAPLSIDAVEAAMARLSRHSSWLDGLKNNGELVYCDTRQKGPLSRMDLHKKIPMIHHDIRCTIPAKKCTDEELCKIVDVLRMQVDVSRYSGLWVYFEEKREKQTRKANAGKAAIGIKKGLPSYRYRIGEGEIQKDPTARKQAIEDIIAVMELPVLVDWNAPKEMLKHKEGLRDPFSQPGYIPTGLDIDLSDRPSEILVRMLKKTVDHLSSGRVFGYEWLIADPFPTQRMPEKIPSWMHVERQEDIIPQLWEKLVELDMPAEKINFRFKVPIRTMDEIKSLLTLDLRKSEYHFALGYWNYKDEDGDPTQGVLNFWHKKNAIYLQLEMPTPDDISNIADIMGVEFREQKH